MDESPPTVITYAPSPESFAAISYRYEDEVDRIVTPQRKTRRDGNRPKAKRQKKDGGERPRRLEESAVTEGLGLYNASSLDEGSTMDEGSGMDFAMPEYDQGGDDGEDWNRDTGEHVVEGAGLEAGGEALIDGGSEAFSDFVEAILVGECGMYQLTDRLFVFNGWNRKKRESTVRSSADNRNSEAKWNLTGSLVSSTADATRF